MIADIGQNTTDIIFCVSAMVFFAFIFWVISKS